LHKITPNIRYIYLDISRDDKKITVVGYYANNASEIEIELLDDISDSIAGMIDESFLVTTSYIVSQQKFTLEMHSKYLLYAIYENF
jgi:hypothetical protein